MSERKDWDNWETLICDERRPGIELCHLQGGPGYEDEHLVLSNSLSNGLRFEITNEDMDWACFHIQSRETALMLAAKLTEWCERMADPPKATIAKRT
jgi:hypothetical protein